MPYLICFAVSGSSAHLNCASANFPLTSYEACILAGGLHPSCPKDINSVETFLCRFF